jgi:hypothetical protein
MLKKEIVYENNLLGNFGIFAPGWMRRRSRPGAPLSGPGARWAYGIWARRSLFSRLRPGAAFRLVRADGLPTWPSTLQGRTDPNYENSLLANYDLVFVLGWVRDGNQSGKSHRGNKL